MNWNKTERWLVPLLVLAGVVLRFVQLPFSCIWLDEAFSISLAKRPLVEIVRVLSSDNGSPLFYFLLHGWIRLFGDGEYVLTLLTVLLDCAVVVAIPFFLREVFRDERIHIAGTACAAFCLPCLHHVTNLRYYSLTLLCTVLSWLFLYRARRSDSARDWLWFVLASIAGAFAHSIYIFVFIPQLLVLLQGERKRSGLFSMLFVAAGAVLWLPSLALQVGGYAAGATPETVPELARYSGPVGAYLLSISSQMLALDSMKPLRMAVAGALWIFISIHIFRRKDRTADDWAARELFLAHLFSVGMTVLISLVRPLFWLDKTDLIGLPLVCGLTGYAISKIRFSGGVLAALIAVNLLGALNYTMWHAVGHLSEQRDVIARLSSGLSEKDAVVETGISHFTVEYYLGQMQVKTGPRYVFPESQLQRPSCINPQELLDNRQELETEASTLIEKLKKGGGRVYVFYSPYDGLAPLYDRLSESFILERSLPVRQHPWGPTYTQVDVYRRR